MIEKYRVYIGLGLILVIIIGSITLLWMREDFSDQSEKEKIAQEVEINNLQKENQDLKDQITKLSENSQGSIAGASTNSESSKTSASSNESVQSNQLSAKSSLININAANSSQLDSLPGVGPTRAQAIIDYRNTNGPFQKPEDIMKVSGIGQATYDKMKGKITVED